MLSIWIVMGDYNPSNLNKRLWVWAFRNEKKKLLRATAPKEIQRYANSNLIKSQYDIKHLTDQKIKQLIFVRINYSLVKIEWESRENKNKT